MYLRWQSRKRQVPAFGGWAGELRDARGKPVRNERGSYLRNRKRADGSIRQDVHWKAVVVENVRIEGQPRQKHVAMLAGITESAIEKLPQRRQVFWDAVHEKLDRLGNRISIEDRRRIEQAIALKVPRLSRQEYDANVKRTEEFRAEWNLSPIEYKPYRPPT